MHGSNLWIHVYLRVLSKEEQILCKWLLWIHERNGGTQCKTQEITCKIAMEGCIYEANLPHSTMFYIFQNYQNNNWLWNIEYIITQLNSAALTPIKIKVLNMHFTNSQIVFMEKACLLFLETLTQGPVLEYAWGKVTGQSNSLSRMPNYPVWMVAPEQRYVTPIQLFVPKNGPRICAVKKRITSRSAEMIT